MGLIRCGRSCLNQLSPLAHLRALNLTACKKLHIGAPGFTAFHRLANLRVLNVSHTRLTDTVFASLIKHSHASLTDLDVSHPTHPKLFTESSIALLGRYSSSHQSQTKVSTSTLHLYQSHIHIDRNTISGSFLVDSIPIYVHTICL